MKTSLQELTEMTTTLRAIGKHRLVDPSAAGDSPRTLRQLARDLGVSASYLSQVKHGKCRASEKLLSKLSKIEAGSETSNPLGSFFEAFGGFDSHALPPAINT
jgi:transcriptional regulator with XRE-family HTH domain